MRSSGEVRARLEPATWVGMIWIAMGFVVCASLGVPFVVRATFTVFLIIQSPLVFILPKLGSGGGEG